VRVAGVRDRGVSKSGGAANAARFRLLTGTAQNAWSTPKVISFIYGAQAKALGAHEDCHILARHFWGSPHADWLDEGLAVYSDDASCEHPLHGVAKLLVRRGQLIPIAAIAAADASGIQYDAH
jgi:hypothetical protein